MGGLDSTRSNILEIYSTNPSSMLLLLIYYINLQKVSFSSHPKTHSLYLALLCTLPHVSFMVAFQLFSNHNLLSCLWPFYTPLLQHINNYTSNQCCFIPTCNVKYSSARQTSRVMLLLHPKACSSLENIYFSSLIGTVTSLQYSKIPSIFLSVSELQKIKIYQHYNSLELSVTLTPNENAYKI